MDYFSRSKLTRPQQLKLVTKNGNSCHSNDNSDDEIQSNDSNDVQVTFVYITAEVLMKLVENRSEEIIIDIRSNRFFQMRHIKYAVNYSCVKKFMSRRSRVKWTKVSGTLNCSMVIVYDHEHLDESSPVDSLKFIYHLQKSKQDVRILKGGFSNFVKYCSDKHLEKKMSTEKILEYAQSPTHRESSSSDVMRASLSEIIPNLLFLGNELDARDKDTLKEHQITDIINVTSNVPFYFENKFRYHRLPASDSDKQDISQYFNEAYRIIEDVKRKKGRVLIHCWAGVSRSVTIATMYLIKTMDIDVLEALKYIQERRRIADPNLNFLGQLSKLKQNL